MNTRTHHKGDLDTLTVYVLNSFNGHMDKIHTLPYTPRSVGFLKEMIYIYICINLGKKGKQ